MAKALGNTKKLYLVKSGSNYTALTGETSSSLNLSTDMIEVSDKTSDWKQYIAGYKGGTADVTIYADDSDEAQKELLLSLRNGTPVDCFIGNLGSGNTPVAGDAFSALVTSIGETYDTGSAIARNISLQITGEVVHYPTLA
jgi:predicted secreted protein